MFCFLQCITILACNSVLSMSPLLCPPLSVRRERPPHRATDSETEPDISDRLGSTDTLSNGNKADLEAAKRLAKRLFNLDGFKKSDVARHLSKK